MGFYEKMRDGSAKRLVSKYGSAMILRRIVSGVYDPATGETSGSVTNSYNCKGVTESYKESYVNGDTIKAGDKKVLLSASGLTIVPKSGDTLLIGSEVWSMVSVDSLAPGEIAVIYTVQIRQ
jgi:hypothetical protein